ncbi:catalase family protein [Ruegeria meonggei]|uniref:catalase family protein n=1 Tax=Ruegeria meonggei TaxID=1446476 RepID=UPI00366E515B
MKSSNNNLNAGAEFETVPSEESEEIDEIVELGVSLQDKRAQNLASQGGKILRGVHAKSHGCVKAEFTVRDDIEEKYRVGLFAQPGKKYEAWIRFSNADVLVEHDLKDGKNGSRGMAIKVMDVAGEMLSKDGAMSNQDFLMVNTPEFAFANVRDYLRLNRVLDLSDAGNDANPYFVPLQLAALGEPEEGESADKTAKRNMLRATMAAIPAFNGFTKADLAGTSASLNVIKSKIEPKTVRNPLEVQYFGAAPFLFGAGKAMKFSAAPRIAPEQSPFLDVTSDNPSGDYLSEALADAMLGNEDICFDFRIQIRDANDDVLNIENATTVWPDEEARYESVAKVTIKVPQTPHTEEERRHCEQLAFSPWHALAAHRPLGGINRLRRKVYASSAKHRCATGY